MIASGEKTEEYRQIEPYWSERLMNGFPSTFGVDFLNPDFKDFDIVTFRNGYRIDSPSITRKIESISIGTGRPEWGAEPDKKYFVIKLK